MYLSNQTVEVGVCRSLNVQVTTARVVQGLVIQAEGYVRVLQQGMRGQHGVVRLHHSRSHLRGRGHGKRQLGLTPIVDRETLQEQGTQPGASPAARGVENEEPLEARAVIRQLAHSVQDQIHNLLSDGVVPTGVVVRRVLLARDDLLGVVQLSVGAGADFVTHGRLQVHVHRAGHMLPRAGLGEKGVEGVVAAADRLLGRHLPIGLDAVLEAV